MQEFLSAKQATAALGGISRKTLHNWVKHGLIKKYKMPGTRRTFYSYSQITGLFQEQESTDPVGHISANQENEKQNDFMNWYPREQKRKAINALMKAAVTVLSDEEMKFLTHVLGDAELRDTFRIILHKMKSTCGTTSKEKVTT